MKQTPRTRSGTRKLREEFNKSVENLITLIEHEEFRDDEISNEIQEDAQKQVKTTTLLTPVLQGIKETALFTISREDQAI
ncbi:unnamed protein product [Arabis nemorensis]|uniref:Uncharacterized protein n=1 Tax=Arabis nemorensis TaxID=586526 RepID=A0A565BKA3_9BRAS|nr:unnamed protein product [Arabis nemorensis]